MIAIEKSIITKFPSMSERSVNLEKFPLDALPMVLTDIAKQTNKLMIIVLEEMSDTQALADSLNLFLGKSDEYPVSILPDWETLPYDSFSPHQDIISERLEILANLPERNNGFLILPIKNLAHRFPPRNLINSQKFSLQVGQTLNLQEERFRLSEAGYRNCETVRERGEFAIRGAIFDIFPMGTDGPFRIDMFDEVIESLRSFDPETQRSIKKVDYINILPAREVPLTEQGIKTFRSNWHKMFEGNPRLCPIYQDISNSIDPPGIEYYAPLFFEAMSSLFDYLPDENLFFLVGDTQQKLENFWTNLTNRYESLRYNIQRPILPPELLFFRSEEVFTKLNEIPKFLLKTETKIIDQRFEDLPNLTLKLKTDDPARELNLFLREKCKKAIFLAESPGRREVLQNLLKRHSIVPLFKKNIEDISTLSNETELLIGYLTNGFIFDGIALIPETAIFGTKVPQRRRRQQQIINQLIVSDISEIAIGDPVVHIDHGIGIYKGLEVISLDDEIGEFVVIHYYGESKLFVPISNLGVLSRYSGGDPDSVVINKLGNDRWTKAKKKATENLRDKAAELLDIYAKRAAKEGIKQQIDEKEYERFTSDFPFELTPDQFSAINSVLEDMQSKKPMDRLICGDVGFGKTEVALRAAFTSVICQNQVIVLVPTTLLAEQHGESFRDRFADWPISIEVMSRFRTLAETRNVLDRVNTGKVDILIGTHRLLSKDIKMPKLGLLIIDEEHRFGVAQKERIKKFRSNVDVLAMTATPIPRTLNLAMAGIRDMSIIATAPARRLAIKTFVKEKNSALIKEAIMRELLRGGQVYFVHNKVQTIERCANELRQLVPEARIGVAHGQMPERLLEQIMKEFYDKNFNILMCSTIIETGIDIPSANTIIIDRADQFGLAQLHQLRGRVGRSHHQAYAYMLTPEPQSLNRDAFKRLEAISAAGELGAGFHLATHDLEIRGAGEFLGEEQSGNLQSIGYSLYMEMLEEAVSAIKSNRTPDFERTKHDDCEIDLKIPALIPDSYLRDIPVRLSLYQRISTVESLDQIISIEVEMIDRFGLLPDQVKNLFRQARIRLSAKQLGISQIIIGTSGGHLKFHERTSVNPLALIKLVQTKPGNYRLESGTTLKLIKSEQNIIERFEMIENLIIQLSTPSAA